MFIGEVKNKGGTVARDGDKTAANLYQVQPYYQRFDQKNNMTRQRFWNPAVAELVRQRKESLDKHIRDRRPGYGLEDWAFYLGANANITSNGFNINWPNRRGNLWQPLSTIDQMRSTAPSCESYGRLEADSRRATLMVKKIGRLFGADQVGVALLDRRWVYSHWFDEETREHYPIKFSDEPGYEAYEGPIQLEDKTQVIPAGMKYAIVLIQEMGEAGIAAAPTLTQMATVFTAYSRISHITVTIAEFIRGLGYHAIPSANDTALNIPLAIDAGLGELGRNAKLITPQYGPRCRISKVITDLPLEPGAPKLWGVTEFCNVCKKCATTCPAQAIPAGERSFEPAGIFNNRGVLMWQLDHMKCYEYWSKIGTNCGICIRVCPFNKSKHWGHSLARWSIRRRNRNVDSFIARLDDWLGYGKFRKPGEFWLE